jgi:hypothetical protein
MRALLGEPVRHPVMNGEHGAFPSADSFVHKERLRRGTLLSKLDNVDSTPGNRLRALCNLRRFGNASERISLKN